MRSLLDLQEAWQRHPRFGRRALGGRRALDGFRYQLAVSLDRFFDAVLHSGREGVEVAFEGLSDLSENRGELTYLTQVKATLTRKSLLGALNEALAVDEFLEEESRRRKVRRRLAGEHRLEFVAQGEQARRFEAHHGDASFHPRP